MNIAILGKSLNQQSGHSLPAFTLAGYLQNHGHNVTMVSDRMPPRVRDGFSMVGSMLREERGEADSYEAVTWRTAKPGDYYASLREIDVIHEFDYISPTDIRKTLGRHVPIIYQASSRLRMTLDDIASAGPLALLNLSQPQFQRSLIVPKVVLKRILNPFSAIVCASKFVADGIREIGVPDARVRVVPAWLGKLGLARDRPRPASRYPVLSYFGWGSSIRGLPDLLEAYELVRNAGFKISLKVYLQNTHGIEEWVMKRLIARRSRKDGVTLGGFQSDILWTVAGTNCIVLPFRSSFGYAHPPLTLLEAMCSGIPVISTMVGSVPELIRDRETGYLVRPRQPKALAKAIQHVVFDRPEEAERVGMEAASHIRRAHRIDLAGQEFLTLYRRLQDNHEMELNASRYTERAPEE